MSTKFPISRKYAPTWQHHIVRYAFALPFCYRKRVLDAGCQMGFGGHLASYVANHVTFADINQKYIDQSKNLHRHLCPTDYLLADFEKESPNRQWDTILAFEVIEHLSNPHVFLQGIKDHLPDGGKLVFSVPHMVENHEHKQLYDEKKIRDLISQYLTLEEFYIQDKNPISLGPLYGDLKCYVGVATKI